MTKLVWRPRVRQLKVWDYLTEAGAIRRDSVVRAEIAHNNLERPIFWVNAKVVGTLDSYLSLRVSTGQGVTSRKAAYRSLDPGSCLFLRADGVPYGLTARRSTSGVMNYSCDSLGQVFRRLHTQAGVEGHTLAGRRTFAVRLYRKGYDLRHIAALTGHQTLTAVRRLVDSDPVKLGDLVSGVV
jgi:site-specific recombinase XerD